MTWYLQKNKRLIKEVLGVIPFAKQNKLLCHRKGDTVIQDPDAGKTFSAKRLEKLLIENTTILLHTQDLHTT